ILSDPEAQKAAQQFYAERGLVPEPGHTALSHYLLMERRMADGVLGHSIIGEDGKPEYGSIGNTDRMGRDRNGVARTHPKFTEEATIEGTAKLYGLPADQLKASLTRAYAS